MYENGCGVKQNYSEALDYYKKSAGKGLAIAQSNVERLEVTLYNSAKQNIAADNNLGLIYGNTRRVFEGNGQNKSTPTITTNKPDPVAAQDSVNNAQKKDGMC